MMQRCCTPNDAKKMVLNKAPKSEQALKTMLLIIAPGQNKSMRKYITMYKHQYTAYHEFGES